MPYALLSGDVLQDAAPCCAAAMLMAMIDSRFQRRRLLRASMRQPAKDDAAALPAAADSRC